MKFPALPHLGLPGAEIRFRHARGLDMHRYVDGETWTYEPDVLSVLLCLLARHDRSRFINVGANIGYFSLIAKKLLGDRVDVHAYEPMPELLKRLKKAQRHNRVRIEVSGTALADFRGTAPFHLSAKSDTSNSLNPDFRPSRDVLDVSVTTLDAEFADTPSAIPGASTWQPGFGTVLLIDTESTEPSVLRGGLEFIERARPAIICEVLAGRTEDELSSIIEQIGYVPFALTDDGTERRSNVVGDRTYQHRDWLFLPPEAPEVDTALFAATFAALQTSAR